MLAHRFVRKRSRNGSEIIGRKVRENCPRGAVRRPGKKKDGEKLKRARGKGVKRVNSPSE